MSRIMGEGDYTLCRASLDRYQNLCRFLFGKGIDGGEYGLYFPESWMYVGIKNNGIFYSDYTSDFSGDYYSPQMVDEMIKDDEAVPAASDQWDTATRGEKMSSASGKVIFKYQMPVLEEFTMKLPKGAEIIRMADQGGMFWLWAVVDTNQPDEERLFHAVKCGANVPEKPNLHYHGFCAIFVQQELGLYIFEDMDHGKNT